MTLNVLEIIEIKIHYRIIVEHLFSSFHYTLYMFVFNIHSKNIFPYLPQNKEIF